MSSHTRHLSQNKTNGFYSQQSRWPSASGITLHVINALVNFLNTVMFKLWFGDNFVTTLVPRRVEH
jgi:hypothetical protein